MTIPRKTRVSVHAPEGLSELLGEWFQDLLEPLGAEALTSIVADLRKRVTDPTWIEAAIKSEAQTLILQTAKQLGIFPVRRKRGAPKKDRPGLPYIRAIAKCNANIIASLRKQFRADGTLGPSAAMVDALLANVPQHARRDLQRRLLYGPDPPSRVAARICNYIAPDYSTRSLQRDKP